MPKYLVNLGELGINQYHISDASNPRDAVYHVLFNYFGDRSKLGLFIYNQIERRGPQKWETLINQMADEIVGETEEAPKVETVGSPQYMTYEQLKNQQLELDLQAFEKSVNKQHPGADIAHSWKLHNKMTFVNFDKLAEIIGDGQATFSTKLDGELVCLYFDGKQVDLVTIRGTIRTGMPCTKEAQQLLAKHKNAAFLAEIYAVDAKGKPESYMTAASILKDPKGGYDEYLRLAVFDTYFLDGVEYESLIIQERFNAVKNVFGSGKYVQPATTITGTIAEAEKLWADLETKGWEGLVVYFGADLYKVKPIQSYDMVIIGVNKSDKFIEQTSAVLCSFMDKEGRFRLSGAIGGGFTDEERIRLLQWAERNKVMEDGEHIWVDPFKEPLIVEIEAIEVTEKDGPAYEFKGNKWVKIENMMTGVLRFPQFVRVRDDKDPNYNDVPIEQVVKSSAMLCPGRQIKTVTGAIGHILAISPRHGQLGPTDFDIVVQWNPPLWGEVEISEVHPEVVVEIWG